MEDFQLAPPGSQRPSLDINEVTNSPGRTVGQDDEQAYRDRPISVSVIDANVTGFEELPVTVFASVFDFASGNDDSSTTLTLPGPAPRSPPRCHIQAH